MNKDNVHYFWCICEDGQDGGTFTMNLKDVTCPKCLEQFKVPEELEKEEDK